MIKRSVPILETTHTRRIAEVEFPIYRQRSIGDYTDYYVYIDENLVETSILKTERGYEIETEQLEGLSGEDINPKPWRILTEQEFLKLLGEVKSMVERVEKRISTN